MTGRPPHPSTTSLHSKRFTSRLTVMMILSPTAFLSSSPPNCASAAKSRSFCERDHDDTSPSSSSSSSSSFDAMIVADECRRYSIRRSASSDARLPSPTDDDDHDDDDHEDEHDDRHRIDEYHEQDDGMPPRLGVKRSNRSLSGGIEFPSPTAGGGGVGGIGGRRSSSPLQTIESEKCLVDLLVPGGYGGVGGAGRPPRRTRRRTSPRRDSAGSHESLVSHYSVDAGKHGFLSHDYVDHSTPPPPPMASSSPSSHACGGEYSTGGGGGGGDADSLIFTYTPGLEVPPAEYALPASILRVYGERADDFLIVREGGGSGSFDSSIVFDGATPSPTIEGRKSLAPSSSWTRTDDGSGGGGPGFGTTPDAGGRVVDGSRSRSTGAEGTASSHGGRSKKSSQTQQQVQQQHLPRILPYHERKRLTRLRAEEKRRKKAAARKSRIRAMQTTDSEEKEEGRKTTCDEGKDRTTTNVGERCSLNCNTNGYGGTDDRETRVVNDRVDNNAGNVDNKKESASNDTKGWFGGLVAIVTGQERKAATMAPDDEENQLIPRGNNKEGTNSYREQAEAFLKRTERERAMMKEQSMRANNLPGGHRSRRSTGSATLHSIVSCSDDEDDDDDTNSSDEGSYSCYLDIDDDARRNPNAMSNTTTPAAPARVWRYGEPPTVSDSLATKKDSASSRRDCIMRRDRLLQEGCDYRLHTLKRRHEAIGSKFRVFVLFTVGVIFVGILGFALALCVRMLTSI